MTALTVRPTRVPSALFSNDDKTTLLYHLRLVFCFQISFFDNPYECLISPASPSVQTPKLFFHPSRPPPLQTFLPPPLIFGYPFWVSVDRLLFLSPTTQPTFFPLLGNSKSQSGSNRIHLITATGFCLLGFVIKGPVNFYGQFFRED